MVAPGAAQPKRYVPIMKTAVAIYTSYNRGGYSDFALSTLISNLQKTIPQIQIKEIILPNYIHTIEEGKTGTHVETLGNMLFESELIIISSPIYNFTYSPYLHIFFHALRDRLLEFDEEGKLVSRNFKKKNVILISTGRSPYWKWLFLAKFLLIGQLKLTLYFWGGRLLNYKYISDCHPNKLEANYSKISQAMSDFAQSICKQIARMGT